jgi:CheY-like chemotaxis protein
MADCFRVLVVEDEYLIREVICCELLEAGFEVIEAANGVEAMEQLSGPLDFDVLFTDIRLGGGPDGWDVAHAFRAKYPGKPVAYASAYAPGERRPVEDSVFFPKPYRPSAVCRALLTMLARSAGPSRAAS